jgi:hypothetical protein
MTEIKTAAALGLLLAISACANRTNETTNAANAATPQSAAASEATAPIVTASSEVPPSVPSPQAESAVAHTENTPPAAGQANVDAQVAATAPDVVHMKAAKQIGKQGVPVDVRYAYNGAPKNGSASLQLAFIPRVQGSALRVEFPRSESVSIGETDELHVQKVAPASVHRHNLVVTPLKADAGEIRALVSMEVEGGRYFGIFVIPVGSSAP